MPFISLGDASLGRYEISHKIKLKNGGVRRVKKIWRRARDLNPRGFHLPVFKTGALGRYASPPRRNLPEERAYLKLSEIYEKDL